MPEREKATGGSGRGPGQGWESGLELGLGLGQGWRRLKCEWELGRQRGLGQGLMIRATGLQALLGWKPVGAGGILPPQQSGAER